MAGGPSSGSYDKSRVLSVKPLRSMPPIFPAPPLGSHSQTSSHPFVSAPPFGPFPPGYSPFYPFYNPSSSHPPPPQPSEPQTPTAPDGPSFPDGPSSPPPPPSFPDGPSSPPLPPDAAAGPSTAGDAKHVPHLDHDGSSQDRKRSIETSNGDRSRSVSQKRARKSDDIWFMAPTDGDRDSVTHLRIKFDALRRRLSQLEDAKGGSIGGSKRADLKASTIMGNTGLRTNTRKRTGPISGIHIGDIFFFRIEMCLVGLHAPVMAGIDYMTLNLDQDQDEETLAVSIVSSGGYEDDNQHSDVLIYSGQGGQINKKDQKVGKVATDQKLERGNLALERSLRRGNEVRVIRGVKDVGNPTGKVYIYDGLYKLHESWMEKGKSGSNVFKYKLLRIPGQPEAFGIWKSVQRWTQNPPSRPGLILPDLTSGAEKLPVSLVNDVDDDKGPAHFAYVTALQYDKPLNWITPSVGCQCNANCISADPNCSCVAKNGGYLPHTANGVLVTRKPMIHECGPSCACHPNCRNQVSQNGLRVRLEVFKTNEKGWGLRSWDPIRAGGFICEYAGQVIDASNINKGSDEYEEDEYIFDTTCIFDTSLRWNYIPELLGEDHSVNPNDVCMPPLSLLISAKDMGNAARFMNHSCSPNVFWQPVLFDHNDESQPHIMLYAIKHIPPMTELTFDYGSDGTRGKIANGEKKRCLCGSSKCRGYFG